MERKKQGLIAVGLLSLAAVASGSFYALNSFSSPPRVVNEPLHLPLDEEIEPVTPIPETGSQQQDDVPEIATISALPLNSDAEKILNYSKQLRIQTVRKLALKEQNAADEIDETTGFPLKPSFNVESAQVELSNDGEQPSMNIALSEQIVVKSILRIGKRREATLSLGDELIPVQAGTQFSGITVTQLSDDSVTLKEGGKTYRRFLTVPAPVKPLKDEKESVRE
ncbi:hypothetical protein ETN89_19610 (plasmid) [Photobacterium damselae subsp. damselae]|uniref:hypothetical protein n=1 Tax=Photobacterium damselae TaxID=38293 RepID=UPI000A2FCD44|nr:hypothetical protein [Photobacterium damselae]ARR51791.1 hypothetical protein CAY62_20460 [Photobacterium damselae subsp. damselae]QAY37476.1 hypothetical protein ETN89_19610 [Photobacterium damselae subsp. damselae]